MLPRSLSKDNLAGLAHQAVNSLRRLVTPNYDNLTTLQQDLVATSKQIEECWLKNRVAVDAAVAEQWSTSFKDELSFQLQVARSGISEGRKSLPESSLLAALDAARILSRTTGNVIATSFESNTILPLMIHFFMDVPMSKKVRDACAQTLVDLISDHPHLLPECLSVSLPYFQRQQQRHTLTGQLGETTEVGTMKDGNPARILHNAPLAGAVTNLSTNTPAAFFPLQAHSWHSINPLGVYLASLLTTAAHRADSAMPGVGTSISSVSDKVALCLVPLLNVVKDIATADGSTSSNGSSTHLSRSTSSSMLNASSTPIPSAPHDDGVPVTNSGLRSPFGESIPKPSQVSSSGAATGPLKSDGSNNTTHFRATACAVYLSLLGSLVRGNAASKECLVCEHGYDFATTWTLTVSLLSSAQSTLRIPTATPGKDTEVAFTTMQTLHSELLELLMEVCADDSFSLRRTFLREEVNAAQARAGGQKGSAPASPTIPTATRYEPIPPHWDTLLTGGSPGVWRLASALYTCTITCAATGILEACLVQMDTSSAHAETMYRCVISTLMLLCAANPQNAKTLADSGTIMEALIAIVTFQRESVFPSSVLAQLSNADGFVTDVAVSPVTPLNTNTTQLTVSFLSSLASVYFPAKVVRLLMRAVEEMHTEPSCQTDVDVVESLLHVLRCGFMPPQSLFFPGGGSVVCKVERFVGRWFGYSFAAWIHPVCVWQEGSRLFSFVEPSGVTVSLSIVANGRSCCLALRVQGNKDNSTFLIPDSALPAETWSHVAFTHSFSEITVFVNGKKLEGRMSAPFPKEPTKHHRLDIAFGGPAEQSSFFGYVASMDLLDGALSEKDVARIVAIGPRQHQLQQQSPQLAQQQQQQQLDGTASSSLAPAAAQSGGGDSHALISIRPCTSDNGKERIIPVTVSGNLMGKGEGISVQGVIAFAAPDMEEVFSSFDVMNWALRMIQSCHNSPNFSVIAKLCLSFVSTAVHMAPSDAALTTILKGQYMERLKAEVLTWEDTFQEFPAIMLSCATPHGGGKELRQHASSQTVFTTLLERLAAVSHAPATAFTNDDLTSSVHRNATSASIILRELSDCLLIPENVALFQAVPGRFEQVLSMSMHLPQECIESVVVLIEKLCKSPPDLEKTLRFLLMPSETVAAEVAKAEVVRMLFDVARANPSMCDMIFNCFKGNGASFLIMLIQGKNHNSETIRVFSLRLLSLMLHVNKKLRDDFLKANGFQILSKAMTDPDSKIPIRLPTFDCLFQMAFDGYRPTDKTNNTMASRLSTSPRARGRRNSSRHTDPTTTTHNNGGEAVPTGAGLQGHLPGLMSRRFKVTRREYSFEVSHDFARVDDRLQFDDAYRSKGVQGSLRMPLALETALAVLGGLIRHIGRASTGGESSGFLAVLKHGADGARGSGGDGNFLFHPAAVAGAESSAEDKLDVASTASARSAPSSLEEDPPESVALRVLSYLEKVADVPANGEVLLPFSWLEWLWEALGAVVISSRHSNASCASPLTPAVGVATMRYERKFSSEVVKRLRSILRKLVVLDMCRTSKAGTIRKLKGTVQPPQLVRMVLEEVTRHFSKGNQCELRDADDASNVIKNLDTLFLNLEEMLVPFPTPLGIEIVSAINAIAVNNNSWVRMRMKNSSHLFDTRKRFAFFLLISTRRLFRVEPKQLIQLLDANAYDLNAIIILLRRLTAAETSKDVDEVETLLLMIRQLTSVEEDQRREVYRILGAEGQQLAELLCVVTDDSLISTVAAAAAGAGGAINSNGAAAAATGLPPLASPNIDVGGGPYDSDSAPEGGRIRDSTRSLTDGLPTVKVIEWCYTHRQEWDTVTQRVQKAAKSLEAHARSRREKSEKERSSLAKATRALQERREQTESRVAQDMKRIRSEVGAEIGEMTRQST